MKEHELVKIKIADVKLDKSNPNYMSQDQMQGLRQSMERWGYLTPIIIDQDNNCVDGEHRLLVYKEFGLQDIQAYRLSLQDDSERRLLRQVMNKLKGFHQKELDADELATLFENNKLDDLSKLIATQREDLERLILRYHPNLDFRNPEDPGALDNLIDDEMKKISPDTQLGDVYQLGRHKLICADCSDKRSIDRLLEGVKPELLLTDPPYGISIVQVDGTTDGGSKPITIGHVGASKIAKANEYRVVEGDDKPYDPSVVIGLAKHHIIFGANYFADKLPISAGWIIWYKRREQWDRTTFAECELAWSDFDIPARMYGVVWMGIIKEGEHEKRVHPTQKPVKLLAGIVNDFTKESDMVLDCYAGAGSTLLACEQTNRACYAVEIDPHYCDIICKRFEAYTGQKAQKLSG